jgi:CRISPR-associated protein Csx10
VSAALTPLPTSFVARLTMLSDWHVGSGAGRPGNIDRLVIRDTDDLPYVPAKTLTGMWRDGCERLAFGLDEGSPNGVWGCLVNHVFGEQPSRAPAGADHPKPPAAAVLSVRSAHLPRALSAVLRGSSPRARALQAALTFVQPGVKIDEKSGRADDDHLRFVEMARGGTTLTADCRLRIAPEFAVSATALLVAGAALVERLGGKRRRGAGNCRLDVLDGNGQPLALAPILDWLRVNAASIECPEQPDRPADVPMALVGAASDDWVTVPLVIELLAPVAVGYRTVGNVLESLDFIPGTYLLPHVTRVLEALGVHVRPAIARGDVRVLNATISIDDKPGRRAPFCFETRKEKEGVHDPGQTRNLLLDAEDVNVPQHKPVREGYLGRSDGETTPYVKVKQVLRTHNTVDEEPQRPTEAVGGVFSYWAIDPEQDEGPAVFRTELRLGQSLVPAIDRWWEALAADEIDLGRSKKDDYGRVRLRAEFQAHGPREEPTTPQDPVTELFVWALSDVLSSDASLRPRPDAAGLQHELEARLGENGNTVKLALVHDANPRPDEPRPVDGKGNPKAFVRVRRVESWNVSWSLPRPTLVALEAGTCARYQVVEGRIDQAQLDAIEAAGIGERTAEGFGQVSFNDPLICSEPVLRKKDRGQAESGGEAQLRPNQEGYAAARVLEEQVWRETIRRAALTFAARENEASSYFHWTDRKPPMTQLGALRDAVRSLQDPESAAAITNGWLKRIRETSNRREKWPEAALDAIETLLTDPHRVWDLIQGADRVEWPTLTHKAESELRRQLWALAVRSLIDACVRAHKRRQDEKRDNPAGE